MRFKYFHILSAIYITGLVISLTASARLIVLLVPMSHYVLLLTGGTWTIPLSFFVQDITTEVYGYERSRHLVQITLIILIAYIGYMFWLSYFPIPNVKNIDGAYNTVFRALPRHLIALLATIFIGNIVNDYLLSHLKVAWAGKYLPIRFIISTAIGEAVLQLTGTLIAWGGQLHFSTQILPFILFSYFYKLIFEVAVTPINMGVCAFLKRAEGIDVYDKDINYNPFIFRLNQNKSSEGEE